MQSPNPTRHLMLSTDSLSIAFKKNLNKMNNSTVMITPIFDSIPHELALIPRWVVWKGKKIPFCADRFNSTANVTDPTTWSTFETASIAYHEGGWSGVGLVLNGDGLVGVDIDKCVDNGVPSSEALDLMEELGVMYVELSPSGTGLRGLGICKGAPTGRRGMVGGISVELYSNRRYLTVTGHSIRKGPIVEIPGFLSVLEKITPTKRQQKSTAVDSSSQLSSSGLLCSLLPPSTIPKEEGDRNRCLFLLARWVKAKSPDATQQELRELLQHWHQAALPAIGTRDFATSWTDFIRGHTAVRSPFGHTLEKLTSNLNGRILPKGIEELGYGTAAKRLVLICLALAEHSTPKPFFLSCRQAGELLGVSFPEASKMLSALVYDRVIKLESKGVGLIASRYHFSWESVGS